MTFLRLKLSLYGVQSVFSSVERFNLNTSLNRNFYWNKKAVERASLLIPGSSCLIKCATLKIMCSTHENIELVVGIARDNSFMSHAWIEKGGHVIFGRAENQNKFKKFLVV